MAALSDEPRAISSSRCRPRASRAISCGGGAGCSGSAPGRRAARRSPAPSGSRGGLPCPARGAPPYWSAVVLWSDPIGYSYGDVVEREFGGTAFGTYRVERPLGSATTKRAQVRAILEQLIEAELQPRRRDPLGAGARGAAGRQPGDGPAGDRRPGRGRRAGAGARQGHLRHRPADRLPAAPHLVLPGDARPGADAGHGRAVGERGGGRRRRRRTRSGSGPGAR